MTTATDEPKTEAPATKTLADIILARQDSFKQVATHYLPAERLVKLAQVAVAKVPRLAKCTPLSVVDALMTCARLGLEPGEPGGVWLVPYKVSKKGNDNVWREQMVCTPIVDYRGLLDVARRSGEIAMVHADIRRAKDAWKYGVSASTGVVLEHFPADGDRGEVVGVYFMAKLMNGMVQATYLTKAEVEEFRKRSKNADGKDSPWVRDWDAMAKKTACRRGVNWLPKTPDLQVLREVLDREDRDDIELEPGAGYEVDKINMPRRIGEKPTPSPSAPPPEPPDIAETAVDAEDDGVLIREVRTVPTKKAGEKPTCEVVDENGVVYKVESAELVPVIQQAAANQRRVILTVTNGTIQALLPL